jgi:DNA-binding XRE family transcriptional regulator
MKNFDGELLRELRVSAGFTQAELAKKLKFSREKLVAIENNHPGTINNLSADIINRWYLLCCPNSPKLLLERYKKTIINFFNIKI